MKFKAVLFDLDGTLLPMDQDLFTRLYFKGLCEALAPRGYRPKELVAAVLQGTKAMAENDGRQTNEEAFWQAFTTIYGDHARADESYFTAYYQGAYKDLKEICGYNPKAVQFVQKLKEEGCPMVLATNPVFPRFALEERACWAGVDPADFTWVSGYETSVGCKPDPRYFKAMAERLGLAPEECLMVGNDVRDDGGALMAGMSLFLVTDCLLNREDRDISRIPHGNFDDLKDFLER